MHVSSLTFQVAGIAGPLAAVLTNVGLKCCGFGEGNTAVRADKTRSWRGLLHNSAHDLGQIDDHLASLDFSANVAENNLLGG